MKSLVFAALLFTACNKENPISTAPADDVCVQKRAIADGSIIPDQYIIAYNSTINTDNTGSRPIAEIGVSMLKRNGINSSSLKHSFSGKPGGFVAKLSKSEVELLKKDKDIALIEPDRMIALSTCFSIAAPRLITWNVLRTGYGDGTGKTAWVIDTGIDFDHPDLTVDAARSKSFISGQTSANDDNGHGTHVAGIIGAKNNTIGILGVASGASLVALKVLAANGEGPVSGIIQALAYVNANAKAGDVVNMSLGEDGVSEILNQQVKNTASRGILIAISAGNDGKAANAFSPANTNGINIYTVSAVDSLDNFAKFSNYGNDVVDYAEPGVNILSTWSNGRYATASGTSMAAPHLAGLLLLNGRNIYTVGSAKNDPDGVSDPIAHK
ncbi:MAG: S8 family serine peptidase [Bacteroidota bacterium]